MSDNENITGQEPDPAKEPVAKGSAPIKKGQEKVPTPRAVSITIYLMAFLGIFAIVYSFTGAYAPYGLFYPAANMLAIVGMFASFAGISSMEKWGLWLFLVMLGLKLGIDAYTGAFVIWELALLIPAGIFIAHSKKMS